MDDCIFCKIVKKEIPAEMLQETPEAVIIRDIHPSAPVHYLVVSKKHIPSIKEVEHENEALIGHLVHEAKIAAEKLGLKGYKLVFNVGREGGQVIDHVHLHILGGWK
ncbi:histidine triad nucleotide-binding protein [Candidatus Giovannonibacteria bacterium RIFCSPLOWO2_01_FULL_43_160]|uniref:Histidine triad nucleotide-binding protein n=2 Tax=Parcubacteria group TaxID=1794811 RepID=A0A1F5XYD9_9BACT|nr:MAG: Histidine triad (HIT) protein [Candidatus Jorgensenbacteria bacterium GW2011_GWF2_41_8]OGF58245.1 MAG: histidine triad nucleotide-binding protein [Candidatus Giovannonibacteria bacterium RIFCSPHIGHO2_01_FULL_43_140]OGF70538.1 MAG: histidine triad nucleotide-binding protein [Candidatus Giovannonibacteria bacterium RIFCSPHIGHO2_02_FULL_44_51]OGF72278.1 MAG: histidine triad nucleotide-binding protein [Candidatus Giovannonibacteria bacterium RIFCSPHIGHO2_12_FULL_44_22]OGF76557.1 MAG: histid